MDNSFSTNSMDNNLDINEENCFEVLYFSKLFQLISVRTKV